MKETVNCIIKILKKSSYTNDTIFTVYCIVHLLLWSLEKASSFSQVYGISHLPGLRRQQDKKKRKKLKMTNTKMTELEMINKWINNWKNINVTSSRQQKNLFILYFEEKSFSSFLYFFSWMLLLFAHHLFV